ncbi:hypothetical protein QBK99_10985 [Corticibacterium sp. UT-5YL-CI-8]|nr:hypothetical protein [Tianweitania sp. UT-5YL-CI-8]
MGGEGPITWATIRAYAADLGLTGDELRLFQTFFGMIDNEWLSMQSDKQKAEKNERSAS